MHYSFYHSPTPFACEITMCSKGGLQSLKLHVTPFQRAIGIYYGICDYGLVCVQCASLWIKYIKKDWLSLELFIVVFCYMKFKKDQRSLEEYPKWPLWWSSILLSSLLEFGVIQMAQHCGIKSAIGLNSVQNKHSAFTCWWVYHPAWMDPSIYIGHVHVCFKPE